MPTQAFKIACQSRQTVNWSQVSPSWELKEVVIVNLVATKSYNKNVPESTNLNQIMRIAKKSHT